MSTDSDSLRVLAIHAHPDDLEFQCAGTLLRLRAAGCHVVMATMTPGDKGSDELPPREIAAVRRAEAQASADLAGCDYACLEFQDLEIGFDIESRWRTVEFLRRIQPDLVITAPPSDYLLDHEMTSHLVRDACFNASVPNYRTHQWDPAPHCTKIPHLYYVDALEGRNNDGERHPVDLIVDVTDMIDMRMEMLACHASQREWLRRQHGIDEYMDAARRWSQARGAEIGAAYGEGFRQYKGPPHPSDDLLARLLDLTNSDRAGR